MVSHLTSILERLVHIELADLMSTCVYLEPGWPNNGAAPSVSNGIPSKSRTNGKFKLCSDCGSLHKEIFEFQRWNEGEPVVQRWGMFVDIYV